MVEEGSSVRFPPWLWVGLSTFVAFVLGFVVMVEGIYRAGGYLFPVPSAGVGAGARTGAVAGAGGSTGTGTGAAPPPVPAFAGRVATEGNAWPETPGTRPHTVPQLSAVEGEGFAPPPVWILATENNPAEAVAAAAEARRPQPQRSSEGETTPREVEGSGSPQPKPTPQEQVAEWRRQKGWVIVLVRYGHDQERLAERTLQRLRPKVPAGHSLVKVESHDRREWLLLLGVFPSEEAARAALSYLPPELVVRPPHLRVVAVRHLF